MAGLMKFACLVLACMIVAGPITPNAALACGSVISCITPCLPYLTRGGNRRNVTQQCCNGVRSLNAGAKSTPDRQKACRCLQRVAKSFDSTLAIGLPSVCGVNMPYSISTTTNCNIVR